MNVQAVNTNNEPRPGVGSIHNFGVADRKKVMNTFEKPKNADTPADMRAEIARLRRENPLVHNAMTAADIAGFSGEDRYTFLAYHALVALVSTQKEYHEHLMRTPAWHLVNPKTNPPTPVA